MSPLSGGETAGHGGTRLQCPDARPFRKAIAVNDDTRIVVHGYAGDAFQIVNALDQYTHHEAPVTVLSPMDAPVAIEGIDCRTAGKRAYTGKTSLDRQRQHLELLLDYPESWFLLHDSDSVCLEPELPGYLYTDAAKVFYNATPTTRYLASLGEPDLPGYEVVFQPPLFLSRGAIKWMLQVADQAVDELPDFGHMIDWYFVAMTRLAGLNVEALPNAISRPIWAPYEIARVYAAVRTCGVTFLHSVKTKEALELFVTARAEHNQDPTGEQLCRSW